jgi:hypothetical protein
VRKLHRKGYVVMAPPLAKKPEFFCTKTIYFFVYIKTARVQNDTESILEFQRDTTSKKSR